jgi:hypothetical protein
LDRDFSAKRVIESVAEFIPEGKQFRVLLITNHEISRIYARKERFKTFDATNQSVRVEVVPEDQADAAPAELLHVVQVELDSINYFKPVGFPFFLRCLPDATLESVRDMIKERLRIPDDVMARYRFVAFSPGYRSSITSQVFELGKVLKREQRIGEVIRKESDRLLMIRPSDRSTGRGTTGSVVLKN